MVEYLGKVRKEDEGQMPESGLEAFIHHGLQLNLEVGWAAVDQPKHRATPFLGFF